MGASAIELLQSSALARHARSCCIDLSPADRCAACKAADDAIEQYRAKLLGLANAVVRVHLVQL